MAQKYMLVPLPSGTFEKYDLVTRAALGALYDRQRLSDYNVTGGDNQWYDRQEQAIFCVFSHEELAQLLGVSEKTVRRSLNRLKDDKVIWWRKATYRGANRYFIDDHIRRELRSQ